LNDWPFEKSTPSEWMIALEEKLSFPLGSLWAGKKERKKKKGKQTVDQR
jgi:hypothetical protein